MTRRPKSRARTNESIRAADWFQSMRPPYGALASKKFEPAGSTLAMTFMLPIELTDPEVRPGIERAAAGARASGTPFLSFFTPDEMLALAQASGFREVSHVSAEALAQRYFAGRADGLRPPRNSEEFLIAAT